MEQFFDIFDYPEPPIGILCNPDKSELYSLGEVYDRVLTLRYNALSEFTFSVPYIVNENLVPYYDKVISKRLVWLDGYGYFKIDSYDESDNGIIKTKQVKCTSIDSDLIRIRMVGFNGTYKFYNNTNPTDLTTLIGQMLSRLPQWSLNTIDSELWGKYRTFNVSETNVYNFMMNDVEKAYGCVFIFDYQNYTMSAYDIDSFSIPTDIFLSYDNLIRTSGFKEIAEEITTALNLYGAGTLDVRAVNPMGTNTVYNFTYFKDTDWMSSGLVTAITNWENKFIAYRDTHTYSIKTYSEWIAILRAEMVNNSFLNHNENITLGAWGLDYWKREYLVREALLKVQVEGGKSTTVALNNLNIAQSNIYSIEAQILSSNSLITQYQDELESINLALSLTNLSNFSLSQQSELKSFIYENTYQNENFVVTDISTDYEIQDTSLDLYNQGLQVLGRVSQPRYEFDVTTANFIFLKEYTEFTNQLELGASVTIEKDNGLFILPVVLEIKLNFDNPLDFQLTFSNRLRLDNGAYRYTDLQGQTVRTASTVNFDSTLWSNWDEVYKDEVTTFVTSALNTANNQLINSDAQEITISKSGLRGRKTYDSSVDALNTGGFSGNQVWLTSNILAFSSDGFATSRLALGEITNPSGGKSFGLLAESVFGTLLAGNELIITNSNTTTGIANFTLDGSGAKLTNASFIVENPNQSKILINDFTNNPNYPFLIQGFINGGYTNNFSVDINGNVKLVGEITATAGTFGGWTMTSTGLTSGGNNPAYYLKPDGNAQIAGVSIKTASESGYGRPTSFFTGDIRATGIIYGQEVHATTLIGRVVEDKNFPVRTDTGGGISGSNIYGGTLRFPGLTFGEYSGGATSGYGYAYCIADDKFEISAGNLNGDYYGRLFVNNNGFVSLASGQTTSISSLDTISLISRVLYVESAIDGKYGEGTTSSVTVKLFDGVRDVRLHFIHGICVDVEVL